MIVIRWILSLIFIVQMYLSLALISVSFYPFAFFSRNMAFAAAHLFCRWVIISARILCGLKVEIRGTPPKGNVIVAAKHHSFFDIIVIFSQLPRGRFVMKRELLYTPFVGQYGMWMGCIPVVRNKRGAAVMKMKAAAATHDEPGQLIIYPQGTRLAPGVYRPYKKGAGLLYVQSGQPCVPVATNIGLFWPKHAILRKPGTAVVEFLPEIPASLKLEEYMARIEEVIEKHTDALLAEEGFITPPREQT